MDTIRTVTAKNGQKVTIRPAQTGDSCAIIDTVRSNANERSYVLMEHYGQDLESEREYIKSLDSATEPADRGGRRRRRGRLPRGPAGL